MAIDPEVQAAIDALADTVAAHRAAALAAIQADRARLSAGEDRLGRLEDAALRLRAALRDGRLSDDSSATVVDALAATLGGPVGIAELREGLRWLARERRGRASRR